MESSALWLSSFRDKQEDKSIQRLITSLRNARDNTKLLTDRVTTALPGLTIHDVSHLDALWEVADVIAGDQFRLNPLETYIFGCAVLLHDACLCFEAYKGGQEAVRQTVEWLDNRKRLASSGNVVHLDQEADFATLRMLHAKQAEQLATSAWEDQDGSQTYIIDDTDLRENYGPIIGKIAGSHHWDIDELAKEFRDFRPSAAFIENNWSVDALTVACLLRVADAGHIDGRRAPTFLLNILQMNSLSRSHWVAQNHLGRLMINPDDSESLLVSSTIAFTRSEAQAWWVAFDAIELFDRELKNCNELLRSCNRSNFARNRIAGAGNPRKLARYVQTEGWNPTESNVHVSDVAALVKNLGGENLYGKDADRFEIALRELVQNSTDAVLARRVVDDSYDSGQIIVRLTKEPNAYILQVDDDGVGMSQTTLIKDMLDFGKSFWISERVGQEFPGLISSGYSPIGRFGIGFFSAFMAADKIKVFSRRFNLGLDDVKCLSFDHGVSLRPILSDERPANMGMNVSTRVELELKSGVLDNLDIISVRSTEVQQNSVMVPISHYIATLVSGIDVPVHVEIAGKEKKIHEGFPPEPGRREQWMKTISYVNAGVSANAQPHVSKAISRLREIQDEHGCYGLAAISISQRPPGSFLSLMSVGGIATPHHSRQNKSFVGLIDYIPANARRGPGEMRASEPALQAWLSEQVELLDSMKASELERVYASYSLSEFEYDTKNILSSIVVRDDKGEIDLWLLTELTAKLESGTNLFFPTVMFSAERTLDPHFSLNKGLRKIDNEFFCIAVCTGKFNDANLAGNVPKNTKSLIGVIHRTLEEGGRVPKWSVYEGYYQSLVGTGDYIGVSI